MLLVQVIVSFSRIASNRLLISQIEDDIIIAGGFTGGGIYVWDHFSDEPRFFFVEK